MKTVYIFQARVWLYPGMAGWHFITVPKELSHQIKTQFSSLKKGWGSIRVEITIGQTRWQTSIFPDKKIESYILPLKSEIRKKEDLVADDTAKVKLKIII